MADRRNMTMRDMAVAMGILAVVVLAFVGLYGGFSFAPGGPTDGQRPTADVEFGFNTADRTLGFTPIPPVGIPAEWHPSSYSSTKPGGAAPATARGGWLTDSGFVTLIQSNGSVQQVLAAEFTTSAPAAGTVEAGGAQWQVTTGVRDEVAWFRTVDDLTVVITGTASPADFEILAGTIAR